MLDDLRCGDGNTDGMNAVSSVFEDVLETASPNTERVYDQILAGLAESAGSTLPTLTRSKGLVSP